MHGDDKKTDGGDEKRGEAAPAAIAEKALITVPLSAAHRTADFRCTKSPRVQGFFAKEFPEYSKYGYTRVFVHADDGDPGRILGYYTLSAAFIQRAWLLNRFQKKVPGGIPAPIVLIGFMGRDDGATKGLGGALLYDAALRVSRITDVGIWGMGLDAENDGLVKWYADKGFILTANPRNPDSVPPRFMYAPLGALLPQL